MDNETAVVFDAYQQFCWWNILLARKARQAGDMFEARRRINMAKTWFNRAECVEQGRRIDRARVLVTC